MVARDNFFLAQNSSDGEPQSLKILCNCSTCMSEHKRTEHCTFILMFKNLKLQGCMTNKLTISHAAKKVGIILFTSNWYWSMRSTNRRIGTQPLCMLIITICCQIHIVKH
jgi:hypothetical protein